MNFSPFVALAVLAVIAFVYFKFVKKPKAVTPPAAASVVQPSAANSAPISAPVAVNVPVATPVVNSTPAPASNATSTADLPIDPFAGKTVAQLEAMIAQQEVVTKAWRAQHGSDIRVGDPPYVLAAMNTHLAHAKESPNGLSPPAGGYRAP